MKQFIRKYTLIFILPLFLIACADDDHFNPRLKNSQNPQDYVDSKTAQIPVLSSKKQAEVYQNFLSHYYSPWFDKATTFTDSSFKEYVKKTLQALTHRPGYDENEHRHSKEWLTDIVDNIDVETFPNHLQNAIVTRATIERSLPTNKPSFTALRKPGFTYPFDDLQESFLPENLPVKILQESQNHAWDLILNNGSMGWVKASALAVVDDQFIQKWRQNKGYIEFKNDHIAVIDQNNIYRFMSRMGAIYPIQSETANHYIIAIAIKNLDGKAIMTSAKIDKKNAYKIPLLATPENVAKIAKQFIGMPYGWGDLYGYRDCSATTKDVFSYFGIWLPRDAAQQAELGGKEFHVKDFKNATRLKMLDAKGIPFFTLIHLDGHIMLYLGKKDGKYYVFHDMWGLKTKHWFRDEGRAVVGKTVITPLDFGERYINVKASLLDRMRGFTVLIQTPR